MKTLLCLIFHNWKIYKVSRYNLKGKKLISENFHRCCSRCEKEQSLQRPKKYDPMEYIWVDIVKKENE